MDETAGELGMTLLPIQTLQDTLDDAEPEKKFEKLPAGKEMSTQTDTEIEVPRILIAEIGIQTDMVQETRGIPIREIGMQTKEDIVLKSVREISVQTEEETESEKLDCVPYTRHHVCRGPGFYQPPEIEMRAVEMEPLQREIAENPVDAAKGGMSH